MVESIGVCMYNKNYQKTAKSGAGMIKTITQWYRDRLQGRSHEWGRVRKEHLAIFSDCEACSSREKLEVHHIEPFHLFPDKELDKNNLITLCKSCHLVIGHLRDYQIYNRQIRLDCSTFRLKRYEAYGHTKGVLK
jgi:5-methylcytosine-specific restriction endonuclease McrA